MEVYWIYNRISSIYWNKRNQYLRHFCEIFMYMLDVEWESLNFICGVTQSSYILNDIAHQSVVWKAWISKVSLNRWATSFNATINWCLRKQLYYQAIIKISKSRLSALFSFIFEVALIENNVNSYPGYQSF